MTIGLGLIGTIGVATSEVTLGSYMFILGTGIGLVMQILVTAVQNAVGHEDLGAATAGANFFRSIGGSFGTAVFGALYVERVTPSLGVGTEGHPFTTPLLVAVTLDAEEPATPSARTNSRSSFTRSRARSTTSTVSRCRSASSPSSSR